MNGGCIFPNAKKTPRSVLWGGQGAAFAQEGVVALLRKSSGPGSRPWPLFGPAESGPGSGGRVMESSTDRNTFATRPGY